MNKIIHHKLSGKDHLKKIIWQELFDIYRDNGGDLRNMSNMLVDYDNCKRLLNEVQYEEFLFIFSNGYYSTYWINNDKVYAMTPQEWMNYYLSDYCVHVKTSYDKSEFQLYKKE